MTIEKIKSLHDAYTVAATDAEKLRDKRNTAIRKIVADGTRVSTVAHALGVTRARVAQIVEK